MSLRRSLRDDNGLCITKSTTAATIVTTIPLSCCKHLHNPCNLHYPFVMLMSGFTFHKLLQTSRSATIYRNTYTVDISSGRCSQECRGRSYLFRFAESFHWNFFHHFLFYFFFGRTCF